MKKIKHLLVLCIAIFSFSSCEKDDDMELTNQEINISNFVSNFDSNTGVLSVTFNASGNPNSVTLRLNPGFETQDIVGNNGLYSTDFVLNQNDQPNGMMFDGFIIINNNETNPFGPYTINPIEWDNSGGNDTNRPYKVHVSGITETNNVGEPFAGIVNYTSNTAPANQESLLMQATLNGQPVGSVFGGTSANDPKLVGESGGLAYGPVSEIEPGTEYIMTVSNVDQNDPAFTFLNANGEPIVDSSGEPVDSITFAFTPAVPDVTAEIVNHDVTVGITTFTINNAEISTNVTESQEITVKLFPQGNSTPVFESDVFNTPNTNDNLHINNFDIIDLMQDTNYDLKYFVNGEEFASYSIETNAAGSVVFDFSGVEDITPSSGNVKFVYTNNTQTNETVILQFLENGNVVQEESLPLPTGSTQVQGSQLTTGYGQVTTITYQALIGGQIVSSGNFTTLANTYSTIQNLNAGNGTGTQTHTPNQSDVVTSNFRFTSNGIGTLSELTFQYTNDSGLIPWDYLLLLGIDGNNVAVNNLANGVTEVTISNLNIAINTGINTIPIKTSTQDYVNDGSFEFNYRTIAKDDQGQIIGDTTQTLTISF